MNKGTRKQVKTMFLSILKGALSLLPKVTATVCGHEAGRVGVVEVLGQLKVVVVPADKYGGITHCPECHARAAIHCVCCGEVIFPGEKIALYDARLFRDRSKSAVLHDTKHVIGCLRPQCWSVELALPMTPVFEPKMSARVASTQDDYVLGQIAQQ